MPELSAGTAQIIKGLNTVLNQNNDDVYIALETMAGKGRGDRQDI